VIHLHTKVESHLTIIWAGFDSKIRVLFREATAIWFTNKIYMIKKIYCCNIKEIFGKSNFITTTWECHDVEDTLM